MISIRSLCKEYNSQIQGNVFEDYSIDIANDRNCIVAENGAGKSTLLLLISGLLQADSGTITFDGVLVDEIKRKERCAIASDSIKIPDFLTAKSVLTLSQKIWQVAWPEKIIEILNFTPHIDKQVGALSAGNLKKLHLINAFMREPSILLLDEPNIALDEKSLASMWGLVDDYEGMLIVASNEPYVFASKGFSIMPLHNTK